MNLADMIQFMPKVELHVHLEGAVQPATLLQLAKQNQVALPADTEAGIREWYQFTDFAHFIEIFWTISECICTADDMELIAREFLRGQALQNIVYTEVIFSPFIHYKQKGLRFEDQLAALQRSASWARQELKIDMGIIADISRQITAEEGLLVADWAIGAMHVDDGVDGVIALGLGGPEIGHSPQKHQEAFERAYRAGLPALPHAGETVGPESIWGALDTLHPRRILHGVRCLEDEALVARLREQQIPLDICPTSNICLKVFPSMAQHPLPELLAAGLFVTINSDDPPMFNTTLTDEYRAIAEAFSLTAAQIKALVLNGVQASLLPIPAKNDLTQRFEREFEPFLNA